MAVLDAESHRFRQLFNNTYSLLGDRLYKTVKGNTLHHALVASIGFSSIQMNDVVVDVLGVVGVLWSKKLEGGVVLTNTSLNPWR